MKKYKKIRNYKKKIIAYIIAMSCVTAMLAGCSSATTSGQNENDVVSESEKTEENGRPEPPEFDGQMQPPEFDGQMQPPEFDGKMGRPDGDGRMGREGFVQDTTYTPLEVEGDLYSSGELDSNPDLAGAEVVSVESNSGYTISSAGTYMLSGQAKNYTLVVDSDDEGIVQIVLYNVVISNTDFPAIYVKSADMCIVTVMGDNKLSVSGEFEADGDTNTNAVLFSKENLILNGDGSLAIESKYGSGIKSKESVVIKSGQYSIDAGNDGIHADTYLVVDGGEYDISAVEGMEATYVQINGGDINISASDDGINASDKSEDYDVVIEINGGDIKIVMGQGDTDGLDANGIIVVNGGNIDVTGQSTFDYDRGAVYNGGTIIINGNKVDQIPESMQFGKM